MQNFRILLNCLVYFLIKKCKFHREICEATKLFSNRFNNAMTLMTIFSYISKKNVVIRLFLESHMPHHPEYHTEAPSLRFQWSQLYTACNWNWFLIQGEGGERERLELIGFDFEHIMSEKETTEQSWKSNAKIPSCIRQQSHTYMPAGVTVATGGGHFPLRQSVLVVGPYWTYYQVKYSHCVNLGKKSSLERACGVTGLGRSSLGSYAASPCQVFMRFMWYVRIRP